MKNYQVIGQKLLNADTNVIHANTLIELSSGILDYAKEWVGKVTLTPEDAEILLSRNHGNRPVRNLEVDKWIGMMKRGQWLTTHQGIALSWYGSVLDGQHRLLAITEAKIPVTMYISTGQNPKIFSVIDTGARRSIADNLNFSKSYIEPINYLVSVTIGKNPTAVDTGILLPVVGHIVDSIGVLPRRKVITTSPFIAAAITTIYEDSSRAGYVKTMIEHLMSANFDELPPIGKSLLQQILKGRLNTMDKSDTRFSCCRRRRRLSVVSRVLKKGLTISCGPWSGFCENG
jgi:hypothetical protein